MGARCGTRVYVPGPCRTGIMFSDELYWRAVLQWQLRRLSAMLEHTWIQYRSLRLLRLAPDFHFHDFQILMIQKDYNIFKNFQHLLLFSIVFTFVILKNFQCSSSY